MRRALPLFVLCLCLSCAPAPRRSAEPAPHRLFVSGQIHGYLEPCGCNRPQLGGLPRRATALAGAPFVENGSLVSGPGRLNEIKFETLLVALSEMNCRALNVGSGELALGLDFLRSARGLAAFPFLSANLQDDAGRPVFDPGVEIVVGDERWWVIGLIDPALARGHATAPVAESARRAVALAPNVPDRVLILYHGPWEASLQASWALPDGLRVLVCNSQDGDARILTNAIVTPGDRGRRLIGLSPLPSILVLDERFADAPSVTARLREYVRRLSEEDLLHSMNAQVEPLAGGYVGDARCVACHGEAGKIHEASRHARAIESLRRTGREVDPDCISCHVVGFGERTGYVDLRATAPLARVGCESCHGPGHDHARAPETKKTPGDARASCHRCHTKDTDPGFRFEGKWEKVRHR